MRMGKDEKGMERRGSVLLCLQTDNVDKQRMGKRRNADRSTSKAVLARVRRIESSSLFDPFCCSSLSTHSHFFLIVRSFPTRSCISLCGTDPGLEPGLVDRTEQDRTGPNRGRTGTYRNYTSHGSLPPAIPYVIFHYLSLALALTRAFI